MLRAGHAVLHPHRSRSRCRDRRADRRRSALRRRAGARRAAAAAAAGGRICRAGLDRGLAAVSTASAKAIWGRLTEALDPLDHAAVLRARPARLARAGLSAPKIRTLKALAKAIDRGARRSSRAGRQIGRRGARRADLAARHRSVDRRHLSPVLPRPRRRLAGRRPRLARGRPQLLLALKTRPTTQGHGAARRGLAAVARRRGLPAVDLLSRAQAARRRAD